LSWKSVKKIPFPYPKKFNLKAFYLFPVFPANRTTTEDFDVAYTLGIPFLESPSFLTFFDYKTLAVPYLEKPASKSVER